jgi:hypothetical protein
MAACIIPALLQCIITTLDLCITSGVGRIRIHLSKITFIYVTSGDFPRLNLECCYQGSSSLPFLAAFGGQCLKKSETLGWRMLQEI